MSDYKEKFEKMRIAGELAARTQDMLTENIKEGISTDCIAKIINTNEKKYPKLLFDGSFIVFLFTF